MLERRSASLEIRGRHISGLAVPWGQRARVRVDGSVMQETFVRDAFRELRAVPLVVEHGGEQVGEVMPSATSRGLEVAGEYSGDLGNRDRFSVEFRCIEETRSESLRIVTAASLHGIAAVRQPAYSGAEIEARQGAVLLLLEGPPGGGKSQRVAQLIEDGEIDAVADLTGLWAAVGSFERGPDGRYPIRLSSDPLLELSLYVKTAVVRRGLVQGLRVVVTTSARNQAEKWRPIAGEVAAGFRIELLDPGYAVARRRLQDADGGLHDECEEALTRWYGETRSEVPVAAHGGLVGWL